MPFIITKEHLKNAKTYMPIADKIETAKTIADLCLENIDIDEQNAIGESLISLPHLKGENLALKTILLTNTLLGYYLDISIPAEKEDGTEINVFERHDYYAGGHLLNQIERFKSDPEVKDIAFDLLSDYKEFKKIVDTELYNAKSNANDPIPRFSSTVAVLSTEDSMKKILEEIKAIGEGRTNALLKAKEFVNEALKKEQGEKEVNNAAES